MSGNWGYDVSFFGYGPAECLLVDSEISHHDIPLQWDDDPFEQLRVLRDAVLKQKEFPTTSTAAFMAKAWEAVDRLPHGWFPRERSETLTLISRFFFLDGQTKPAIDSAVEAIRSAVLGKHGDLEVIARARHGTALRDAYDFSGATRELVHAIEIAREQAMPEWEAKLLNSLGNTYNDAGLQYEALALFERAASFFESVADKLSAWMALDNAALAALRLGDIDQAISLTERAARNWCGEPRTADEKLWVVQGAITRCQLLIQVDRAGEAVELARGARSVAEDSGTAVAKEFAALAETISKFAAGSGTKEAMHKIVAEANGPSSYWVALDAVIRTYEATGHLDEALAMQQRLLEFTRRQKAEEVRQLSGGAQSSEEVAGTARLTRLSQEIRRRISGLVDIVINQSLRAGHDHARIFRLGRLAELFASSLGWPSKTTEQIALAAKLIDIGSIVVPSKLLTKRRDLSLGERAIVSEHAKFGAELLANTRLELLQGCVAVVRCHHERWDGGGAQGLAGGDIPVQARIISLCDAFDSLTHERPWRRSYPPQVALQMIEQGAGTRFDPQHAGLFVNWLSGELTEAKDFLDSLGAEALESEYVRVRRRFDQLIREVA